MNIAIIPARGGSKRIPRKNIKNFCGKPIIAWSIEAAIKSRCFDQIICSTDDEEIAEIARHYGASTPFLRPKKLSDDFTGTNAVVKHAIEWLKERGDNIEYVCCIYATAPLIQSKYIREGFVKLIKEKSKFSFSVTTFSFPVQRALSIKNNLIYPVWSDTILNRSQDLVEYYHDAGQFYWGLGSSFVNDIDMFNENSTPVIIPRYFVQDIDTYEDWKEAESIFKAINYKSTYKINKNDLN